jgi:hypothetical protein
MTMGTYSLDGVALDDPAGRWMLSSDTKLSGLPAPGLSAVKIPGVHGTVPIPPSVRDAGGRTIGLLVTDNNAAGQPTGDHQQLDANKARLLAMASPIGRLPVLRHYPVAGGPVYREAPVRLLASVDPDMADPYTATLVLPFEIPGVYLRESVEIEAASGSVAAWTVTPAALAGTTGTITNPVFLCAGALTAVTIADAETGRSITWTGNQTAGQWLRIDPAAMAAYRTTAEVWAGGTDVSGGLSTGPGGFDLNPDADLNIGWTLTRTGGSGVNKARARRAFL